MTSRQKAIVGYFELARFPYVGIYSPSEVKEVQNLQYGPMIAVQPHPKRVANCGAG